MLSKSESLSTQISAPLSPHQGMDRSQYRDSQGVKVKQRIHVCEMLSHSCDTTSYFLPTRLREHGGREEDSKILGRFQEQRLRRTSTRLPYSRTHSNCGCLHKTCAALRQSAFQHRGSKGSQVSVCRWRAANSWRSENQFPLGTWSIVGQLLGWSHTHAFMVSTN